MRTRRRRTGHRSRAGLERGDRNGVLAAVPAGNYRAAAQRLLSAWAACPDVAPAAVALAVRAARERVDAASRQRLELVWTGPETHAVKVRRTEQALLEVANRAVERIVVVSFSVFRADAVVRALVAAAGRAVRVELVLEPEQARRLGSDVRNDCSIYVWPDELRPTNETGRRGVVHAKCAVADARTLLLSSANLTESALTLNMELGLLVEGGDIPRRVQEHLDALVGVGALTAI
jgi:phosphatidylserine/phosphatidylglycerophosphate/cardiolipin synthase-like enzyme